MNNDAITAVHTTFASPITKEEALKIADKYNKKCLNGKAHPYRLLPIGDKPQDSQGLFTAQWSVLVRPAEGENWNNQDAVDAETDLDIIVTALNYSN